MNPENQFDRQKRISGWNQEKIEEQKILVVGAGALGNEVIKLLLQLGVKEISLVDYDIVSESNLNRCIFFTPEDVEKKAFKTDAIITKAKKISPETKIDGIKKRIEEIEESFFNKFSFAFSCLDNLGARIHLNAQCYSKMPLVDGGLFGMFGKVQTVEAPSPCLECSLNQEDYKLMWKKYSCIGENLDFLDPKTPAVSTINNIIAGIQVNEFIKKTLNWNKETTLLGKYLFYDGIKNTFSIYEVPKRRTCNIHYQLLK